MRCSYGVFQVVLLILLVIILIVGGFVALYMGRFKNDPEHILELSLEEKREFLESFDHIISHCDGVIWLIIGPIKDAGKGFSLLKDAGKSLNFISNNAMRTDDDYIRKMDSLDIRNLGNENFIHPDKTIAAYLKSNPKYKKVFVISGSNLKNTLRENGFILEDGPHNSSEFTIESFTEAIVPTEPVDAVILDFSLDLTYARLNRALLYAKTYPDCDLIIGASDSDIPLTKEVIIPGPSFLIDLLEKFSGKKATILGKPGSELKTFLRSFYNITKPDRYLFIGDNLLTDIEFGNSLGFQSLFVLTGVHTYEDMMRAPDERKPTYYANSMADFVEFFKDLE